ncbi:hypothetical protein R1flu_018211 [Riccia fluitans]|uniref:Secreted protein n=1 Tax=Riccia fluitans TaxID=41844 RepID=A0ABD1ZF68_9MARC
MDGYGGSGGGGGTVFLLLLTLPLPKPLAKNVVKVMKAALNGRSWLSSRSRCSSFWMFTGSTRTGFLAPVSIARFWSGIVSRSRPTRARGTGYRFAVGCVSVLDDIPIRVLQRGDEQTRERSDELRRSRGSLGRGLGAKNMLNDSFMAVRRQC